MEFFFQAARIIFEFTFYCFKIISKFLYHAWLPPPVPDHCSSTFKYFLAVAKNTKTILRDYLSACGHAQVDICDNGGVYRRLSTAKKCRQAIKHEFFAAPASTNARRRKYQEKKDDPSLAIGKNYINKMFLFF